MNIPDRGVPLEGPELGHLTNERKRLRKEMKKKKATPLAGIKPLAS